MKRTFTIRIKDQAGLETVEVFKSKRKASLYCSQAGQRKGRFEVEITVQCGSSKQSEKFIRENL